MPATTPTDGRNAQLKSGRLVGINLNGLMNAITHGTRESVSYASLALRLLADKPESLREPAAKKRSDSYRHQAAAAPDSTYFRPWRYSAPQP